MTKMKVIFANLVLFLFAGLKTCKWKRSIGKVAQTQHQYLFSLLKKNEKTKFGVEYQFSNIDSIESFQRCIPISSHEDMISYIDLIAQGETNILTKESVYRFGVSSGSTNASKLIPYTKSLSNEFQRGINPWFWCLFKQFPSICLGRTYWSISPIGQNKKYSEGGIPIGFDDEQMYFSKFEQFILDTIQIAPKELSLIKDIKSFRYATLRFLLGEKNLTWVSIWNPTFITLIFSSLKNDIGNIINDIRDGLLSYDCELGIENEKLLRSKIKKNPNRSNEIINLLYKWKDKDFTDLDSSGFTFYEALWPKLKLISCWADGEAVNALPKVKMLFPNVLIQPKGLIATEAFISFPFKDEKSALSINSHFFEFELEDDSGNEQIKLAHELEIGKRYEVIITTGGGLYRYRLNDVITVLGFKSECPLIRFTNRKDKVVDVMGEKLNEQFVKVAVLDIFKNIEIKPNFWIVSPEQFDTGEIAYTLFIQHKDNNIPDNSLGNAAKMIEAKFLENYHYRYCRQLGQLGELKVFSILVNNPEEIYLTTCLKLGQRLGDIKTTVLHPFKQWSSKFQGKFITKPEIII